MRLTKPLSRFRSSFTAQFAASWVTLALLAGCATAPKPEPMKLQVLAINDFHGNLLPPAAFRMPDPNRQGEDQRIPVGGSEALATAVKTLREGKPNHVFVAAGDLIGASPLLSALFFDEPAIESLSTMGLHFSAVGNHEFDRGKVELLRRQNGGCHPMDGCRGPSAFKGSRFQYLAASTIDIATGKPLLPAYQIRHFEGIPVAFIGLSLAGTPGLVMPSGVAGLRFEDEAETINRLIPEIRSQGAETIVVMIHEGGYPTGGYNECPGISGPILDILKRMDKAVDLVVTGHTHRAYNCMIEGRRVTSGDKYGSIVTDIELRIDRKTRDVVGSQANNVLVRLDQFAKDPEQTALLAAYIEKAKPLTDRPVGLLAAEVRASLNFGPVSASPMGQLVADAQLAATQKEAQAEIAFMNSCGVRAGLPMREGGVIRYEDLFTAQPFDNQLVTMSLSGAELIALLQRQWRDDRPCNLLHVSEGLGYRFNPNLARPDRLLVDSVRLNGQPIDPQRDYRITVNSFMAEGGDGFVEFTKGRDRRVGPRDIDALEAYVTQLRVVQPPPLNRVVAVN